MAAQTVLLFLAFESVIRGPSTDGGPMCNLRFRSSDNSFNNLPPETWCMYLGETWSPVALTGPQRDVLCRVWSCHRATTTYTCTTSWNCEEPRQLTRYDGDPRGVGLVVDICEPEPGEKSGHFLIPQIRPTHIDQDTIEYLRRKGVFDFPTPAVCEMMIRTYFYYVHPFFPVVDAHSFLDTFENERSEVSVHLLWSMFLAAANFADDNTLRAANFLSRKDMKRAMYIRAKVALYDAEYERRKITLIQAVLLTGFWYSDTEDRTGPWHWNGIAISLCQTIGLHRHPDTGRKHSKAIPTSDSSIWRQLWWSCFYREAWFSAGMGRPMRINLADCSTRMPDANDSDNLLAGIPECIRKKYLPEGTKDLSKLWTELLTLTISLAKILSWQNRAERTRPGKTEIQHMDDTIRQYSFRKDHAIAHGHNHVVSLHMYHLELYLDSVLLTLYRPFLFDKPLDLSTDEWTSTVLRRTKDAATNTNRILGNMIGADMISNTQAMVCIALVPALQIHLLDATSEKQMVQRMGRHNLEFCMMVIEELKSVYFGAEILSRMFTKAKNWIYYRTFAPATAPRGLYASVIAYFYDWFYPRAAR
ncbi:transcriptional regulator family: Fungal Specific TF [Aspergillus niger]|nr:transcriptional regulator family: Fungal Specific TF [Aspergillus niger]